MKTTKLEQEIKKRKVELANSRCYELDDPGHYLERMNDKEEIEILQLEKRLLEIKYENIY